MRSLKSICAILIAIALFSPAHTSFAQDQEKEKLWSGKLEDGTNINKEELYKILTEHKKYLYSFGKEGINADLKGANLKEAILVEANLQGANLEGANLQGANLEGANLEGANLHKADLRHAKLQKAHFDFANLQEAVLRYAKLQHARFDTANLQEADLDGANLRKADLSYANLQMANLRHAKLQDAILTGAMLQETTITDADLNGCLLNGLDQLPFHYYEPKAGCVPYIPSIADAQWLKDLTYRKQVHGLVDLREEFKRLGYREQERKITYAILHTQVTQLIGRSKEDQDKKKVSNEELTIVYTSDLNQIKGYLNLILFEKTCEWGISPGRPLIILFSLILPFSFFYMFSFILTCTRTTESIDLGDGIWKIWSPERANKNRGSDKNELLFSSAKFSPPKGYQIWGYGLYFSLISAFHVGWRDFNVGNWIARMQPREYRLQPSGWIRLVSGLQSLISVYLLALTVLTYFGRPFESYAIGPRLPKPPSLQQVEDFGANPGNLKMFTYIPSEVHDKAPLVVALHGCSQNAKKYANLTEWNELADRFKFYVVYPEQQSENNRNLCFNWFSSKDKKREQESLSIKHMIKKMIDDHANIDNKKVFVTGLSAGGYMTTVLLATFPKVFAGGAVMAGGPYGCATDLSEVKACTQKNMGKSSKQWGDLVRNAFPLTGSFPIISIFHGNADSRVQDINMRELVDQWTNVHQWDPKLTEVKPFRGHTHTIYYNKKKKPIVETYHLQGMGHAISVDPGNKLYQGGTTGVSSEDKDIYSSFYAAQFWGIVPSDIPN